MNIYKFYKNKAFLVVFVLILIALFIVYWVNRPMVSIYQFRSGLTLNFDLNKWHIIPDSNTGDILENTDKNLSILFTAAKPEDSSKNLSEIVDGRLVLLTQPNLVINKEPVNINGLDFFKITYQDKGDENVVPVEQSVNFVTLHNGYYITMQIYYKANTQDIKPALDIISTIKG